MDLQLKASFYVDERGNIVLQLRKETRELELIRDILQDILKQGYSTKTCLITFQDYYKQMIRLKNLGIIDRLKRRG